MNKIAIVTDSTAYIPKDFVERHNIRVIPLKIHWDDTTLVDGVDITPAQFYDRLEKSSTIPSTSQPSAGDFLQVFKELAPHYDGIIAPLISSGISGTVDSAEAALAMFSEIPVEIIDTHSTSAGLGLVVTAVAQAVSDGKSLKEIKQLAEDIVKRSKLFFVVDTLKYLHKNGRIGGASRYLGSALSIKPILFLDDQGKIDALEKVRTKRKATERLIQLAVEKADGKPVNVGVMHANAIKEVMNLRDQLLEQLDCAQIEIYEISPVIGAHVGPGSIGLGIYTSKK
ncbi:MAG: DegV family protein [Pelolinea sp.]|nr:DegV family protein [Pelolinea sp.]